MKAIHLGEALLAPELIRRLVEKMVTEHTTADEDSSQPDGGARMERVALLTARELEVLRLIGLGRSNTEIANDLYLGVSTVKSHVNTLYAKIQARDRAQAVIAAYESGLVTPGTL